MKTPLSQPSDELLELLGEAQKLIQQRKLDPDKPRRRKRSRRVPVSLSDEELLKVLAIAKTARTRDWVMILITYRHGLRASETLNLRRSHLLGGRIVVCRGKGSAKTDQPLMGHENSLLDETTAVRIWLDEMGEHGKKGGAKPGGRRSRDKRLHSNKNVAFRASQDADASRTAQENEGDDRIFPLTRQHFFRLFRQYCRQAGIAPRKSSPHKLKHSIAKHLIRAGVPANEVKKWLGWKSLTTADHYTEADEEEVAASVDRALRGKDSFRRAWQEVLFK